MYNQYIRSSGIIDDFDGINESGFIPVEHNRILKKTDFDSEGNVILTTWGYLQVACYNDNKQYVRNVTNPSLLGYVETLNYGYIRFCYNSKNKVVLTYDDNVDTYIAYEYEIHQTTVCEYIENFKNEISEINTRIDNTNLSIINNSSDIGSQWYGKTWYAYGTSITSVSQGKYVNYLAKMANMNVVNNGVPGGGIGNLGGYSKGQVMTKIMNTTDGKLQADLITLECGANDTGEAVPLGTIYDTDETTLCGCLNMCIRYLQENTTAQIVIFPSVATITMPNQTNQYYETVFMFEKICKINRCYWIDGNCNLGWARITNSTPSKTYTADNIHQTNLGGYILAKSLWYHLRNIPTFDTAIPDEYN